MPAKLRFVDLTSQLRTALVFLKVRDAYISRIAKWIPPLPRKNRAQPISEAEIDEVVEAPCGCTKMPNRIKTLDYVRTPARPPVHAPPAKSAVRR